MKQLLVLGLCAAVAAQMAFGAHSETAGTAASHAPLPVSRAPFEQSAEVARRPVSLASWPFHPPAGSVLLCEQRLATWAEFRSSDKVAVVDGYDGRIHYVGRTGFGKPSWQTPDAYGHNVFRSPNRCAMGVFLPRKDGHNAQ